MFSSFFTLPQKSSIHLNGEGVIFKRRDLTEDVGQDQIDKGDSDGRKILEEQTDQPVVSRVALFQRCLCGEVDEVKGSSQQRQNNQVED